MMLREMKKIFVKQYDELIYSVFRVVVKMVK